MSFLAAQAQMNDSATPFARARRSISPFNSAVVETLTCALDPRERDGTDSLIHICRFRATFDIYRQFLTPSIPWRFSWHDGSKFHQRAIAYGTGRCSPFERFRMVCSQGSEGGPIARRSIFAPRHTHSPRRGGAVHPRRNKGALSWAAAPRRRRGRPISRREPIVLGN